ncbi:gamma-glutamylcyclotransferase family protein [Deinococcus sp.]|uniref:gamma-glutamylcyclotransferase family protein n=1 Tax=Deinococcus sp. TaxID=47478 RepID=UPI003CC5CE44
MVAPSEPAGLFTPSSVFVYGTLMPGERYERVAHAAAPPQRAEPAHLDGYTLYDLRPEGYPALAAGGGRVYGWVLHYGAGWEAALPHLDDLEGLHLTPPLYRREQVQASTQSGPQRVWVYLYTRAARLAAQGAAVLPSGRWTDAPDRQGGAGWPGSEEE